MMHVIERLMYHDGLSDRISKMTVISIGRSNGFQLIKGTSHSTDWRDYGEIGGLFCCYDGSRTHDYSS